MAGFFFNFAKTQKKIKKNAKKYLQFEKMYAIIYMN